MNDLDPIILEDSLKILRENSDTPGQLQKLYELGDLFQSKRQYQKALIYARQALDLSNEKSNLDHQVVALVNIGCVYWEMSQLKKAMKFYQDALSISERLRDKEGQGILRAIIGISYWRKREWSVAMNWFEKALQNFPDGEIKTKVLEPIGTCKYKGLRIVMDRGIGILKNRIKIAQSQNDPERILLPSFSMIPLVFFTGRKESISPLLKTIIPLAQQLQKNNILNFIPRLKEIMRVD